MFSKEKKSSPIMRYLWILLLARKSMQIHAVEIESLGNYLTNDQVSQENLCGIKECLLDAGRLVEAATDQWSVNPCDDFREFSMGNFIRFKALHDRYDRTGFLYDVLSLHYERQRKTLIDPIREKDPRVFKIAKNFFQQCIDSDYIKNEGKLQVATYLKDKFFPLVDGADWWPDTYNLSLYINQEAFRLEFFVSHRISRCEDPRNPNTQIFCWKFTPAFSFLHKIFVLYPDKTRSDFWGMLTEMNFTLTVDDAIMQSSIDHLLLFFQQIVNIDYPGRKPVPVIVPIKDTSRILLTNSKLNLNWLSLINDAFLERSQAITGNEEILIEDSEIFIKSMMLFEETAPRIMTDVIMLGFLLGFQHMYVVYPFTNIDSHKRGTKKDYQRFEQCITILETNYGAGLVGLYARKFFKPNDHSAAEKFIREAIDDVIEEMSKADDLDENIKSDVITKLKTVLVVAGYPKETVDLLKMTEMYDEIELQGNEGILEATIRLIRYNNKLENEPNTNWMSMVNQLTRLNNLKYLAVENVLYIPPEYIQYPFYDPKRSRFFNTATLFTEVVLGINEGMKTYIKMKYKISYELDYDSIQLGYKNYVKWDTLNKGAEKNLPSFQLTGPQMYWLSFANSYYMKYHTNVPFYQLEALNLQYTYFHVWLKARPEFREAFNCTDLNDNEQKQFEILKEKFSKVHKTS